MYHYVHARLRDLTGKGNSASGTTRNDQLKLIDRIDDPDIRSSMLDLYDRMSVAERKLFRVRSLLKTLRPALDVDALVEGREQPAAAGVAALPTAGIAALCRLMAILQDEERLGAAGLFHDGRRVRRKTGTRDEFLEPDTLNGLHALLKALEPSLGYCADEPRERLGHRAPSTAVLPAAARLVAFARWAATSFFAASRAAFAAAILFAPGRRVLDKINSAWAISSAAVVPSAEAMRISTPIEGCRSPRSSLP